MLERLRPVLCCWGVIVALVLVPRPLRGQEGGVKPEAGAGEAGEPDAAPAGPIVYAFVLMRAGGRALDPFGSSGRREVIQLLALGTPFEGRFLRARLDRLGSERGWQEEGWYRIRGDTILFYHHAPDGGVADVEGGRYLPGRICMLDRDDGRLLEYDYLPPNGPDRPGPPTSPAPPDARCVAGDARPGERVSLARPRR